jgi:hypothetical protein
MLEVLHMGRVGTVVTSYKHIPNLKLSSKYVSRPTTRTQQAMPHSAISLVSWLLPFPLIFVHIIVHSPPWCRGVSWRCVALLGASDTRFSMYM